LKDFDAAEASAQTGIRLDKRREVPRMEYVLGVILEAKGDFPGAREHLTQYLTLDSKATDVATVRTHMENLGKPRTASDGAASVPLLELQVAKSSKGIEEAGVRGGMKALAAIVHLDPPLTYFGFYSDYCRAIVREVSVGSTQGRPQFIQTLRTYLAAISEM